MPDKQKNTAVVVVVGKSKNNRDVRRAPEEQLAGVLDRLRRLEDRDAIVDAIYRYHHTFGAFDCDNWLECFTKDALFRIRSNTGKLTVKLHGWKEMAPWYRERASQWPRGTEGYHRSIRV